MDVYKESLNIQNTKSDIIATDNIDCDISNRVDNNTSDENTIKFEDFPIVCGQLSLFITENNNEAIDNSLKYIRRSVIVFKNACLPELLDFHIFELITQLLHHSFMKVRMSSAKTICILIKYVRECLQFFLPITDFTQHILEFVTTCESVSGISYGLYSLSFFFKKYYLTYPNLFFPHISIPFLNSIFNSAERLMVSNPSYSSQEKIKESITLFYIKLCKTKIDPNIYNEIILPWISLISSAKNDVLISYLFRLMKNLIIYDNMSKNDFFQNSFIEFAIQEIIVINPKINVGAFNLLASVFDKGLQIKELMKMNQIGSTPSDNKSVFDRLMDFTLNSIDKYHQKVTSQSKYLDMYGKVSAAATRMLTSAIKSDLDHIIVNILTSNQNNNFGFLSIIDNLCNNGIFSLSQASSYCLIEIFSRVSRSKLLEMNNEIYKYRDKNKLSYRSIIFALITIAKMDDDDLVIKSLTYLYDLTDISRNTQLKTEMFNDYYSVDGPDTLNDIKDQSEKPEIIALCSKIIQIYDPTNNS